MEGHEQGLGARSRALAAVLALAAGAAWGLARACPAAGAPRTGPAVWAAADRDACALVMLDSDLFVTGRLSVPWPERVVPRRGGGFWVQSVPDGHARGARHLLELDPEGRLQLDLEITRPLDLEPDDRGGVLLLLEERSGEVALLAVESGGSAVRRPLPPEAASLAHGSGPRIAVAAGSRGLLSLTLPDGPLQVLSSFVGRSVVDVVAAPGEGWWILVCERLPGGCALARLGAGGEVLWASPCPRGVLAHTRPEDEFVWLLSEDGVQVYGWGGAQARPPTVARLSIPGGCAAAVDAGGGLLVAAPGAVLRLDPAGRTRPGQGGFDRLVDVVWLGQAARP